MGDASNSGAGTRPEWFQTVQGWPVLGPIALRLGPFGCGAALFAITALFCVTITLAVGGASLLGFSFLGSDEVGVVEQAEAQPTASPTQRPAASPIPSSTPTEEPASAACEARSEDPEGDTFNRDTGEPEPAPGPDIVEMASRCEAGRLLVSVWFADPELAELEVYSFAIEILLRSSDGQDILTALWQLHAGEVTREVRDAQSGEVMNGDSTISINEDQDRTRVDFELKPPGEERPIQIFGRSFYKAGQTTTFLGDEATMEGGVNLP